MKARVLSQVLAGLGMVALASGPASAATIFFSAGSSSATAADNGTTFNVGTSSITNDSNPAVGSIDVTGSIDNWTIDVTSGISKSPNAGSPFALDLTVQAECVSGACDQLDVELSDSGFTTAAGGFIETYTTNVSGDKSTTTVGVSGLNNVGILVLGPFGPGNLGGSGIGTGTHGASYSLQLVDVFDDPNKGTDGFFSTDNKLTAVPEPASLFLMGTGLIGLATIGRRLFSR